MTSRVTPDAVKHFRAALARQPAYEACRERPHVHCDHAECGRYLEHSGLMMRALRLMPHEWCPLWVTSSSTPPDWIKQSTYAGAEITDRNTRSFLQAVELRRELEAAAQ